MKTLKKLLLFVSALSLSLSAIAAPKDMLKERRNIENFSKLVVNGAVKVFLTQGKEVSLIIEGKQEMIDAVATHSANGTLVIEPSNKDAKLKHKVSIFITVPNLEEVSIDAVAKVEMTTDFSCGGDFFLSSNGKASIEGKKITCSELSISMSGASECDLHFDAKKHQASYW